MVEQEHYPGVEAISMFWSFFLRLEIGNAASFLLSLQRAGISKLDGITEEAVISVFVSPDLTPQETQYFRDAMDGMSNLLTLRDRAIGKLAYYTGLRCCDIAAMELASIDWECDIIRVKQQKTDEPLELPLTATVGNAIYDYPTNECPPVDCPILFFTRKGPYRGMESSTIWLVATRIMDAAGIRQSKGDRKGFHIFRHHLATTLLSNGVGQAVISDTLGHAAPKSVEAYLSADFVHLKECALSTACFPVSEGVFVDE
jgi:integrase